MRIGAVVASAIANLRGAVAQLERTVAPSRAAERAPDPTVRWVDKWGAMLDLVAGGDEGALVRAAAKLADHGDFAASLRIADLALAVHRDSAALATARQRALQGLRLKNQFTNPFKFIIYSEMAGAELPPLH